MPFTLAPDTPPDRALRQIVAECQADLLKYRAVVLSTRKAIGIHQTRVALRRLRAVLTLFRGAVSPNAGRLVRSMAAEAKWLAGECAPARDLHVFLTETVEDVPPLVRRIATRLARTHLERARSALSGARYNAFEGQLTGFVREAPAEAGRLDAFGRVVLDKRHAKVEQRGRHLKSLDDEDLHKLRIAIKKQRYAAAFLQPAFSAVPFDSKATKAYIEATVRLQGALGTLNDRVVAAHMLDDIAVAARPTEDVAKPLRKLAKQSEGGEKDRRRKVERAWKKFSKAERFWRTPTE
ncbi:MAG: CHAD domain-containing protein [Reyranella sp.]|uniref:CHAD domain-containing protein n=1 Tax=Reyranella sp. TaxID=1929291 RepID=UPI001ACF91C8|nr:CHAD domain-containing protein [Reyranella sp.]MBN9089770.1 CHAD domain-containing protein [Reyranella sp.]